jgi:phenylpyruvate tautomerase PptA (4-oxalocrotonate tautomerase family)
MPLVRLEIRRGRSAAQKQALLDAAHDALVQALGIPDHDRMQRIVEHARDDFELPPTSSDDFVLVEVTMFAGRSRQAKRRLYQALVRNFGEHGVAATDVLVVLHEPPMDNWGIRGGQMASEVDWGSRSTSDGLPTPPAASPPERHRLRGREPAGESQRRSIILA